MDTIETMTGVTELSGQRELVPGRTIGYRANLALLIIHRAWGTVDFEDLADGYGEGQGTHGDWSGIRDSSEEAHRAMLERALAHMTFNREEV